MKSMRELMPRKSVQIVKRYLDTFNESELADIVEYIEDKKNPHISDDPAFVIMYADEHEAKIEKRDGYWWLMKGKKEIFKIDENGDVTKPKGKKVIENIFEKSD
jgi:hypothetical protein